MLAPAAALAGAPHARAYQATVASVAEVKSFELEDDFVALGPGAGDVPIQPRVRAAACRIRV